MSESPSGPWWDTPDAAKRTYRHPVGPDGPDDRAMPVVVVRGAKEGPTLVTFAGVHGDEYEPMAAVQQTYADLAPDLLTGTWVGVVCCNVDAWLAADREGPDDGKNLARVFPGRPDGSLTERIAHCLTEDFIAKASFLCDLHAAGSAYRMVPLAGFSLLDEALTQRQREAAKAFGLPWVWGTSPNEGRSLSAAAERGVPAIYCETSGMGSCRRQDIDAYAAGLANLMCQLGMRSGRVEPPPNQRIIEDPTPDSGHLQTKNVTPVEGLFLSAVDLNDDVSEGDLLGTVVDLFGQVRFECRSDRVGTVIMLRHLARVEAGDSLAVVV